MECETRSTCGTYTNNFKFQIIYATFAAEISRIKLDALKKFEMPYLTKEKIESFFTNFNDKTVSTGSIEGQITLLTERINRISEHLQTNNKDFSTHRGLVQLVGKRKRLLTYLSKQNLLGYRQLIEKLGLRK
jgi:small subunit ribosomal protein S15